MHNVRRMEPLDLSKQPPRAPRAELDGIILLPRSIDKARAYLDGGNRNGYNVPGVTAGMLERFGISNDDFIAAVGTASTDADIVAFVRRHANQTTIDEWNAWIKDREPRGNRNLPEVQATYPWLKEMPELNLVLDILAEDDRRAFAPLERSLQESPAGESIRSFMELLDERKPGAGVLPRLDLPLNVAFCDYDRTRPLSSGSVKTGRHRTDVLTR